MKSGTIKFIILLIVAIPLSSCQTMDKSRVVPSEAKAPLPKVTPLSAEEEEVIQKKIESWEEYMQFEGETDFSPYTLLRLTEDYLEAKEVLHKKKTEEYELNLELYNRGEIKTLPELPVYDYSHIISRFRILKDRFQYGKGGDAIHYILGYALYEEGKLDEASKVFEEFIKDYPESEYRMEVNFRLGETYFETGQMGEAIEAYNRITPFPDSIFYEKAVYKLGWIYYKMENFKKTIDIFVTLLDRKWGEDYAQSGVGEEAVYCIALSMNRFTNLNQATQYFESKGFKVYTPVVLTRLADLFVEQEKYDQAVSVLKRLTETFPEIPSRPFTCDKLAALYEQMGDDEKAASTRWELINAHNPQTAWYRKNCADNCGKVDELVSKTLANISKKQHIQGKKEDNINYINNAIKGYRLLLSSYPNSPGLKEVNLLLAEALFDARMYPDAIREYEKTAQLYQQGAERGEIAYTMLLAYEILSLEARDEKGTITEPARQTVDTYRGDLTECGKLDNAHYKLANIYAQTGSYDKARETISPMLKGKNPVPAYQKTAELFLKENNLPAAEETFSKLLERSGDPNIKEELARIRYKVAEEQTDNGKYKEAAAMFGKAFDTSPGSKIGEASLLKIGAIHIRTRNFNELKNVAVRIAKAYPASVGAVALLVEGGSRVEKEEPLEAVSLYESAATITSNTNDTKKLVLAAGILAEESENYKKARELFIRYIAVAAPAGDEEADLRLRLAHCQLILEEKEKGFENLNKVAASEGKVSDRFVAKARLMLTKNKQGAYLGVKLTQPFEETLKKKTLLLEGLLKDYSQIVKYKVYELQPEIFFQMGSILENFKDSILQSEKPTDITKQELEEYSFLLEEKSYPYEEQAVKAYEKSLQAGRKQNLFNDWVDKSVKRLADLKPALYKRELGEKTVDILLIEPDPATFGGDL